MARPRNLKTGRTTVNLSLSTKKRLDRICNIQGCTMNMAISQGAIMLLKFLEEHWPFTEETQEEDVNVVKKRQK